MPEFICNDLQAQAETGDFRNSSPKWRSHYNATLIVPILRRDVTDREKSVLGFLTVDSMNAKKNPNLFTTDNIAPIMHFGADLLALVLRTLEFYDRLPADQKGGGNGSQP
jgi:hypothetical protein